MKQEVFCLLFLLTPVFLFAQKESPDSIPVLGEVIIRAFEQDRRLETVPVAVNKVSASDLSRYTSISLLPAINANPGVRMEERSPGSLRMNIRGSTVRSPFGVRNIKVYWNGIPFTDPGGGTYLNHFSAVAVKNIEILKGPAGSLYGAGTGGVLIFSDLPSNWAAGVSALAEFGSFNTKTLHFQLRTGSEKVKNLVNLTLQDGEGYREHTNWKRKLFTWQSQLNNSENVEISTSVLLGDLYYQTPGALNKTEFLQNPGSSRPAAGVLPSAVQANAHIDQLTFLSGINALFRINPQFQNSTTVYGAFSRIRNPTFRNYEKRAEPHFGARSFFTWLRNFRQVDGKFIVGAEYQQGFFNTSTFSNNNGIPGNTLTLDDINNHSYFLFVQSDFVLPGNWNLAAGISLNKSKTRITRLSVPSFIPVEKKFNSEWCPRLAISKKLFDKTWFYGIISKGFSAPTVQEILPSTSVISINLQPEDGTNYELGLRSRLLNEKIYTEINAYIFNLDNAIVLRRDSTNADYFINAGSTKQKGIEAQVNWRIIAAFQLKFSYALNDYNYKNLRQDSIELSGKEIPSIPKQVFFAGADLKFDFGGYVNASWLYNDRIALNNTNTDYAAAFNTISTRIGWKRSISRRITIDIYGGVENLTDNVYSLGNDINAAGGRYYNAAPGRSYYIGLTISGQARN